VIHAQDLSMRALIPIPLYNIELLHFKWHILSNSPFAVQLPLTKRHRLNISRGSSSQNPAAPHHSRHVLTSQSASVRVSLLYRGNSRRSKRSFYFFFFFFFFFFNFRTSVPSKRKRLQDSSVCGIVKALKKVKWRWQCMWNYRSSEERKVKLAM
jgi:hypothetical protein